MNPGDLIEVHTKYNDSWSSGFEIVAVVTGGYQIRRLSDGRLLPAPTSPEDVRSAGPSRDEQKRAPSQR